MSETMNKSTFTIEVNVDGDRQTAEIIREWEDSTIVRLRVKVAGKQAVIEIAEHKLIERLRHIGLI